MCMWLNLSPGMDSGDKALLSFTPPGLHQDKSYLCVPNRAILYQGSSNELILSFSQSLWNVVVSRKSIGAFMSDEDFKSLIGWSKHCWTFSITNKQLTVEVQNRLDLFAPVVISFAVV